MHKMVLVPFDKYQRLLSSSSNTTVTLPMEGPKKVLSEHHQQILSTSSKGDSTMQVERQKRASSEQEITHAQRAENSSELLNCDTENLQKLFPKALHGRARMLLSYIMPY